MSNPNLPQPPNFPQLPAIATKADGAVFTLGYALGYFLDAFILNSIHAVPNVPSLIFAAVFATFCFGVKIATDARREPRIRRREEMHQLEISDQERRMHYESARESAQRSREALMKKSERLTQNELVTTLLPRADSDNCIVLVERVWLCP